MCDIRLLHDIREMESAQALFDGIWASAEPVLSASTMVALAHAGNYVAGVFDGAELVGGAVAFFGPPPAKTLHSHLAGVVERMAGRGVGTRLKQHQRTWALERGVETITWTFDPAISRNAHLNLTKLGARPVEYLENVYGELRDERNAGSPTDRVLAAWRLLEAPIAPAVGGEPVLVEVDGLPMAAASDARIVTVAVPRDIERLRAHRPSDAAVWRLALRATLAPYIRSPDWAVTGFVDSAYVIERTTP